MRLFKFAVALLVCVLVSCVVLWKVAKQPSFQFFGDLLYRAQTEEMIVALTFDDGPSPNNTLDLLAILREEEVPATFFMIGQNIEKYPGIAKEVLSLGHQIANHSYSHKRTLLSSQDFFKNEIRMTDKLIREIGYSDEIVFRPPFGKKLFNLPLALKELNKLSVTWDAESEDTETQEPETLKKNVLNKVQHGSIILFHDGFAAKPGTKIAVRDIIRELQTRGYQFVTINEMRERSRKIAVR